MSWNQPKCRKQTCRKAYSDSVMGAVSVLSWSDLLCSPAAWQIHRCLWHAWGTVMAVRMLVQCFCSAGGTSHRAGR